MGWEAVFSLPSFCTSPASVPELEHRASWMAGNSITAPYPSFYCFVVVVVLFLNFQGRALLCC